MHGGTKAREAINQRFLVMIPSTGFQVIFPVEVSDSKLDPPGSSSRLGPLPAKIIIAIEVPRLGVRFYEHSHFMDRSGSYRTGAQVRRDLSGPLRAS
jgi:hypothetical protein